MIEADTLTERMAAEAGPNQNNIKASVVTFYDTNPGGAASPLNSSGSTTRTIVVDATKDLEAGSTASSKLIPGVNDVTKGVKDVVRNTKECVRIFRIDNEIFEVNQEQLDRVRMSKCDLEGVGKKICGSGSPRGDSASTNAKCSWFFRSFFSC
jgi:hypothetical protein